MINPMDLTGKHIIVTGASSGIGRATCVQASKLGARISLIARDDGRLKETLSLMDSEGHSYYSYDLSDTNGIEDLVKEVVAKDGKIDGLAHCAGITGARPLKLITATFAQQVMQIHYFAFAELVRTASIKNHSNEGASYVGISSVAAIRSLKATGAYAAAKGAMNSAVHSFAKDIAEKKIRVNTVAFGMVNTDMYKSFIDFGGNHDELSREQYLGIIPPENAGDIICFLLSNVSLYMTGVTLVVGGVDPFRDSQC